MPGIRAWLSQFRHNNHCTIPRNAAGAWRGPRSKGGSPAFEGDPDGLINVLSHEQFEAITDPDLNAWFDSNGEEDSDKCNFNFGVTSTCTSTSICSAAGKSAAAKFNQTFGSNDWMIQQQWENSAGGKCVQHL
ncbi:MAG TPA: hypothetical protein VFP59_18210 [Candidatus Angelobacter sp.]|nr:hypothetical protein [Candidatus Angelobacter sp.]